MKLKNYCIVLYFIIQNLISLDLNAQSSFGFKMPESTKVVSIPFEVHNNLVVIPITLNGSITLKFILDTGVETAILTEKLFADLIGFNYVREMIIDGPGVVDTVEAYVAPGVTFSIGEKLDAQNMTMLVLKEDYLKLSESTGIRIHGIIGYDVFSRFIVDINYEELIIKMYDINHAKKFKKFEKIPLTIDQTKPFINVTVNSNGSKANVNAMIDTGASHAALIDFNIVTDLNEPKAQLSTFIGRGIAGEIPGFVGRIDHLHTSRFTMENVLVSAPLLGAYNKVIKRGAREGTIGGEFLRRFRVIFDYNHEYLYLKKNRHFKDKFKHDMSGIVLTTKGLKLDTLKVADVYQDRPGYQAGIKRGDVIESINGLNIQNNTLTEIHQLLDKRDGYKIRMRIIRNDSLIKKKFKLKEAI